VDYTISILQRELYELEQQEQGSTYWAGVFKAQDGFESRSYRTEMQIIKECKQHQDEIKQAIRLLARGE
jgi:hypothetical protein